MGLLWCYRGVALRTRTGYASEHEHHYFNYHSKCNGGLTHTKQWRPITTEPTSSLVRFIDRCAKILSDLLFGDIHEQATGAVTGKNVNTMFKPQLCDQVKGNVFATTVMSLESTEDQLSQTTSGPEMPEIVESPCCALSHNLEECKHFQKRKHMEKIDFLLERGICFACLCPGHLSQNCNQCLTL